MILWNIDLASHNLATGKVSSKDERNYVIADTVLMSLIIAGCLFKTEQFLDLIVIECFLIILISLFGIQHCYNRNSGDGGKDFIKRASYLGLPAALRLGSAFLLLGIIQIIVEQALKFKMTDYVVRISESIWAILYMITFYLYLGKWMRITVERSQRKPE